MARAPAGNRAEERNEENPRTGVAAGFVWKEGSLLVRRRLLSDSAYQGIVRDTLGAAFRGGAEVRRGEEGAGS